MGGLLGLGTQYFINLEIERYTLATGETALTGFSRYWRHWGLFFAILAYFANLWPGWVTSSATLVSYVFGGTPSYIAIGMLVVIGLILTLAPVVYVALERAQMLKVAAVVLLFVVGGIVAVGAAAWSDVPTPDEVLSPMNAATASPVPAIEAALAAFHVLSQPPGAWTNGFRLCAGTSRMPIVSSP